MNIAPTFNLRTGARDNCRYPRRDPHGIEAVPLPGGFPCSELNSYVSKPVQTAGSSCSEIIINVMEAA